jgi:multiple sugar transport system permease protein
MTTSRAGGITRATRGVGAGGRAEPARQRPRRRHRGVVLTMWLLVLPSLLLLLIIHGYPLIFAAVQSVTNGNLVQLGQFVGLNNFWQALTLPTFWPAARFTLVFTLCGVFGSWVIGLALALMIRRRVHARGLFKTLLLLPWVVPIVVSSTAWNWLVANPQSPIPLLFKQLGFGTVLFLANPTLAQITLCVFKVWISFPFMLLMMSSALAAVDENVYEAARVDGASSRQVFFQITMPLIARSTYISWILMTIFCVNDFPSVYLLTGGGPVNATTTLVVLAFQEVFNSFQTGPGVAIAFILTLVAVAVSVVLFRQIKKVDIE